MWLSREDSNEPGKYHLDRAPYQKGPLDAISDNHVESVVLVWASQTGKTLLLKMILGYFMAQDPSAILFIMPTLPLARTFSKRRITPMLRDVEDLKGKVKEARAKDSTNNALEKTYPGGVLTIVGANSAASLSSNPIKIVMGDERDKWPLSAAGVGDPWSLAVQRSANFEDAGRKLIETGTPGVKDISPLEKSWENSAQAHFLVPCPSCKHLQRLIFAQLKWEKDNEGNVAEVWYQCEHCNHKMTETDKPFLLRNGIWKEAFPHRTHKGFHINALYSPWFTWKKFAQNWTNAKRSNNPEILKQVINENLAEWWDDKQSSAPASHELTKKVEQYTKVPERAVILTAGVDVQETHLVLLVAGWGEAAERWHIHREIIPGKPTDPRTWAALDKELDKTYLHASGVKLPISCIAVDSSAWTEHVYRYCKARQVRRVFAVKGDEGPRPIVDKPKPKGRSKVLLYIVGVDTLKSIIYQQLQIPKPETDTPLPGYMHFNQECDFEYFQSLTAEKLVQEKGRYKWKKIGGRANEVLDCWNYAYAAHEILNPSIAKLSESLARKRETLAEEHEEEAKPRQTAAKPRRFKPFAKRY